MEKRRPRFHNEKRREDKRERRNEKSGERERDEKGEIAIKMASILIWGQRIYTSPDRRPDVFSAVPGTRTRPLTEFQSRSYLVFTSMNWVLGGLNGFLLGYT